MRNMNKEDNMTPPKAHKNTLILELEDEDVDKIP